MMSETNASAPLVTLHPVLAEGVRQIVAAELAAAGEALPAVLVALGRHCELLEQAAARLERMGDELELRVLRLEEAFGIVSPVVPVMSPSG